MSRSLVIALTGASSGIGAALAAALAMDRHVLFVCARRESRLGALAEAHSGIRYKRCDVTQESEIKSFLAHIEARAGRLDVLINCAGTYGPIGPFDSVGSDEWIGTLNTNLFGTYLMAKHAVPLLCASSRPRIINFAGGGAFDPLPNYSAYAVSKAAIVRLTETIAAELRTRNIMVNAIAPGFVATEIHDATLRAGAGQAGEEMYAMTRAKLAEGSMPIDVPIDCVRYLISPKSDGLTGKTISASFDPWATPEFSESISDLNASPVYTMKRVNLRDLPDDSALRVRLQKKRFP